MALQLHGILEEAMLGMHPWQPPATQRPGKRAKTKEQARCDPRLCHALPIPSHSHHAHHQLHSSQRMPGDFKEKCYLVKWCDKCRKLLHCNPLHSHT